MKKQKLQCLETTNSLYVEKTKFGYFAKPCCVFLEDNPQFVDTIAELTDNPYTDHLRRTFEKRWQDNYKCRTCVERERAGVTSRRQYGLKVGGDKIVRWDLRPGHTCNLKCAMCSLDQSSKWLEDIDVLEKYQPKQHWDKGTNRTGLDWDYLYEQMKDTAQFVYIAGGEPFYMKDVQDFLERLAGNEWNRKNTIIQIQTNGVSNTPKFIDILKKFDRLEFSISLDGWGPVNELIRFPTNQEKFIENTNELFSLDPQHIFFNVTIQAMNLPTIDKVRKAVKKRWQATCQFHFVTWPEYLSVHALKPEVVKDVLQKSKNKQVLSYCSSKYKYDKNLNEKMQNYLIDLDKKRGTDSKTILPWCFV